MREATPETGTRHAGGCLCGAVRMEIRSAPSFVSICHCNSCRRATGGVMVGWATFPNASVAFTKGQLTTRESSKGVLRGHCALCGTHVSYQDLTTTDELDITLGALDDPSAVKPMAHIWTADKLPWVHLSDELPQYFETSHSGG